MGGLEYIWFNIKCKGYKNEAMPKITQITQINRTREGYFLTEMLQMSNAGFALKRPRPAGEVGQEREDHDSL